MPDPFTSDLKSPLHASETMRAIMGDRARLQRMLDFEAALARAEAALGIISATDAVEIAEACVAERYDLAAIAEAASQSGDIAAAVVDVIVRDVGRYNSKAANFVHWGASGQDLIDTALMLELRSAIGALLGDIDTAIKCFIELAGRHRRTLTAARTMLRQSQPMPFGLKLSGYAAALARSRDRLQRLRREALVLQFGGTGGTLAALGQNGAEVADRLGALLDLALPEAPWHGHRDRVAEVGANFAILAGTCAKIARDVALLMPADVGEVTEPRRHLTGAAVVLSAAAQAPNLAAILIAALAQDHEGGFGDAQTEWLTIPTLALVTSGALDAVVKIAEGLEINAERMRANLDRSGGRIMTEAVFFALAEKMDRPDAQRLVEELSQRADENGRPLRDLMLSDTRVRQHLTTTEIDLLFVPATYLGSAQVFIDRAVFAAQPRIARRPEFRSPEPRLPSAPQSEAMPEPEPMAEPTAEPMGELMGESIAETKPAEPALEEQPSPGEPDGQESPSLAAEATPSELPDLDAPASESPPAADEPHPAEPVPEPGQPAHAGEDAPGAFMDVLSRAEAESRAEEQRKRS